MIIKDGSLDCEFVVIESFVMAVLEYMLGLVVGPKWTLLIN